MLSLRSAYPPPVSKRKRKALTVKADRRIVPITITTTICRSREKRKPLDDRLSFIYGTEFISGIGIVSASSGTVTIDNGNGSTTTFNGASVTLFSPSVGIGFVLGVLYDIKPNWYISAEIIPSVTANGTFGSGVSIYGLQANFNSSSVGITGAYRF